MNEPKVLIVDDRSPARRGLKALLGALPAVRVVGEAASGGEAMRLIRERRPDVVLIDARMPDMDGLEATRRIKAELPGVRVIVLTLHGALRAQALAAGADAFLIKGCPTAELVSAIAETGPVSETGPV